MNNKGVSMRNLVIAGVIVVLALIVISQSLYVVQETDQVVVTRFGDVRAVQTVLALRGRRCPINLLVHGFMGL